MVHRGLHGHEIMCTCKRFMGEVMKAVLHLSLDVGAQVLTRDMNLCVVSK